MQISTKKVLGKLLSLALAILGIFLLSDASIDGMNRQLFIVTIGIESLVFLNAISPLALGTVVIAQKLVAQADYFGLFLGYIAAYLANLISYGVGRYLGRNDHPSDKLNTGSMRYFATYWHPQLASLCAFDCGLERILLGSFLMHSIPVSGIYYLMVCGLLALNKTLTFNATSPWLTISLLGVWLIYELRSLLVDRWQSPPPSQ
jgi:hypothetical protein